MKCKNIFLGLFFSVLSLFIFNESTVAGNPYINVPEQQRLSQEAWQHYWNSLTPRQQYLVQSIGKVESNYYNQHGRHIPINQTNLYELMRIVGARQGEENFVLHRMQVYVNVDETIRKTDDLIDTIMKDRRIWGY